MRLIKAFASFGGHANEGLVPSPLIIWSMEKSQKNRGKSRMFIKKSIYTRAMKDRGVNPKDGLAVTRFMEVRTMSSACATAGIFWHGVELYQIAELAVPSQKPFSRIGWNG